MIFSLVLPGLLVFIFAILAPICLSVYYGFTDYSGMGQATFIGMENYKTLLHDKSFGRALLNSLLLAIGFICIQHPIAIVVAAVLDKLSGKAEGFFRCVYFIPNVISVAVIAYLWKFIYNPDFGLLNNVLKVFGYQGKINWFSADNAIWSVLIVLIWHGFGWGMLIYYTGIKNIDPVLYEAAAMDGLHNRWQELWFITLPMMKPQLMFSAVMSITSSFGVGPVITALCGYPTTDYAAHTVMNHLTDYGTIRFEMGYASAIAVFLFFMMVGTNLLIKHFLSRVGE